MHILLSELNGKRSSHHNFDRNIETLSPTLFLRPPKAADARVNTRTSEGRLTYVAVELPGKRHELSQFQLRANMYAEAETKLWELWVKSIQSGNKSASWTKNNVAIRLSAANEKLISPLQLLRSGVMVK
jgi:hypothetical protein